MEQLIATVLMDVGFSVNNPITLLACLGIKRPVSGKGVATPSLSIGISPLHAGGQDRRPAKTSAATAPPQAFVNRAF